MLIMPQKKKSSLSHQTFSTEMANLPPTESESRSQEVINIKDDRVDSASFRKRSSGYVYSADEDVEADQPVDEILHQFGTEMQKTITGKRRRIENFAKQCSSSREKLDAALAAQRSSRSMLQDEFRKQAAAVLNQWQNDIERIRENEEKLASLWNQQMKLISQARAMQNERYKSMKLLHDQYCKSYNDLESTQEDQQMAFSKESGRELANLQKKFVNDTKIQELANMRKSLQSLLYQ